MLPPGIRVAAFFLGVSAIAVSTGLSAQDRRGPGGHAAPAARPAGPPPAMARPAAPPAMARPAAPPAMARPAAPAFRAAPPPQRPAMAPHAPPRIAAPSRPSAPHIAAPRAEIHRAAPPQRPAMTRHPEPRIATPSGPGASPAASARPSRKEQIETRAQQREQRIQQRQQIVQERQRDMLSRQSTERQTRIDRLQQRVQQLQSQKPEGLRAQRAQERSLQTQNRLLQREQRMQQSDQARLQRLSPQPSAERTAAMQAAARGRFAAQFRSNDALQARTALTARENGWAPRHAWQRGHRAAFVAWLGPVFWPYAYSDIFEYTFWPYAYDPGYWAYAYDDFVDTVFWGTDSPYSAYARYPEPGAAITDYRARGRASVSPQTLRQLCAGPDKGVTAWPIEEITRAVQPRPDQRALLDELKAAATKAADVFSCADSYAMTPPGRLRAMTNRVSATLDAVKIVRPALEQFYNSLNDEQKARFNALGPNVGDRAQQQAQQEANAEAEKCGEPKSSLTQLPIERMEAVLHPAGKQKEALDRLSQATKNAVERLQAACPDDVPLTPLGRLEAMEKRLEAMLQAAALVQPALDEFYAALSNEQKARFNTLQQTASP
jgi:LTXXQ motif family protein